MWGNSPKIKNNYYIILTIPNKRVNFTYTHTHTHTHTHTNEISLGKMNKYWQLGSVNNAFFKCEMYIQWITIQLLK